MGLSVGSSMISLFLALVMLAALVQSFSSAGQHSAAVGSSIVVQWLWAALLFLLKLVGYVAGSLLLIPRLTRFFLRRYSDSVMQYIFVLSVMFLSAALTNLIGLEGIFGAFFSGLILNRYIPKVSPLMNRIEFIGNAIFIPYFLIGVGMLINVRTMLQGGEVLWIVLPQRDGNMMFGLTSAHAAGAIAMVMVGMRLQIVNDDMLNGVVMMILVTCVVSTLVTERAAQQTP